MSSLRIISFFVAALSCVTAFTTINHAAVKPTSLYLAPSTPPPPPQHIIETPSVKTQSLIPGYTANLQQKMNELPSISVSLQDRKIPTQEEINQKKLTFNLWFWGGGIIAPFIATVFYFGFKFWEK